MSVVKRVVKIEKFATALRIPCEGDGSVSTFPSISIFPFLKAKLTEYETAYDYKARRTLTKVKYQYFKYNRGERSLLLPVNALALVLEYLDSHGGKYEVTDIPPNESIDISITDTSGYDERDYQAPAIDYLISDVSMKALELQAGKGKTFIAIKSILSLNKKALIILPANLVDQWHDVLSTFSDANLAVIKGSKSIYGLFAGDFNFDTDIYIASISTLFEYATGKKHYDGLPSFSEFIKRLGVGIKITDECHLSFYQNTIIDIQCNVEHNIYLSATHMRSGRNSNDIFKRIYPNSIRYGGGKYDKYVNITECEYGLGTINEKRIITKRGYSQFKYEQLIMGDSNKTNTLMDNIMIPLIEEYYMSVRKPGQKLLILVGLTEFAEMITEWMKITYPTFDSQVFLYKTPESVLETADIIISTIGSCGTGKDISNLRSMILLVSFASDTLSYQTLGRLRKMENDTPEFVWMYNRNIPRHVSHRNTRRLIYSDCCKTYNKIRL